MSSSEKIPNSSAGETDNRGVSAGWLPHLNRSLCVHFKSDFILAGFDLLKVDTDCTLFRLPGGDVSEDEAMADVGLSDCDGSSLPVSP